LVLAVASVLAGVVAVGAAAAKPSALDSAKAAMRAKRFDEAVKLLAEAGREAKADEAMYLKALSLHYAGKHAAAIKAADALIARRPASPWKPKARFLKAKAMIELRDFKGAEAIYEAEANRLLSEARKQEVAGVIIKFADALATKPDPDDVGAPPPNYTKAYNLYAKALAMEIARALRDEVMFKRARTIQLAGKHAQAVTDYRAYLAEFDPDWTGPVGSAARLANQKRENPPPAGKHPLQVRYRLAESQLGAGDHRSARVNTEDLLTLIDRQNAAKKAGPETARLIADARWLGVRTYRLPNPAGGELDQAVRQAAEFARSYRTHPGGRAMVAAWWIAEAYRAHRRADQAIAAYEDFIAGKAYTIPTGEAATTKMEGFKKSPAALHDDWRKLAVFQIGQIRFGQKKYAEASAAWQRYVKRYPNGPQWAACQQGMINAEFQVAVDAIADKEYEKGRKLFDGFLSRHPLDARARQILFTLGQIDYAAAVKLEADKAKAKANAKAIAAAYRRAVDRWERLVSKYPGTAESSLALYRVGVIHEEKLDGLAKALDAYRRLTWGSYAAKARARVAVMTRKHLEVRTERKFRTREAAKVTLSVRNIEKLTFKQYFVDLEAYFRKTHAIGRVDGLDIDLIAPDKTWEVTIDGYAKYKPITQEIEIPFAKGAAGVCIVNVGEEDLEATALVIRSNLEIIAKSSRREALVFVQDVVANAPAKGVKLLLSDGQKVFGTGVTGDDGVFRGAFEELKGVGTLRAFALRDGSVASNLLSLSGLKVGQGLSAKGYLYTDRPAYQPGQTVKFRGILRDVVDGSYAVPVEKDYLVSVTGAGGRLLWQQVRTLSSFGTFHTQMTLDAATPLGRYTITARRKDKPTVTYSAGFEVLRFKLEKMRVSMKTDRAVYFRGETVECTIKAEYYWGQPVAEKRVRYVLPDGRQAVKATDAEGKLVIRYDTSPLSPGRMMVFRASIEGENVRAVHQALLGKNGFTIGIRPSRPLAMAGEPFDVEIKTTTPDGKPVGREVTLFVLRRKTPTPEPVLAGVPWINAPAVAAEEVTVEEHKVVTDEKTGVKTVSLTLTGGGQYILRATAEDRFKHVVTRQGSIRVSDDDDATKLRFFAAGDTLQVGREAKIRLHSRVEAKLALLTYEAETILTYKVIKIAKGYNPVRFAVSHEHFPNFRLAVAAIDGRVLRVAAKPFTVERQLNVTVKPLKDAYRPGEPGKVELTVTDQLGKPVRGELSLALINEALFAVYADTTPKILDFFQTDARRHAEFRVASTCAFRYAATTRKVVKAIQAEGERLDRAARELSRRRPQAAATPAAPVRVVESGGGTARSTVTGPGGLSGLRLGGKRAKDKSGGLFSVDSDRIVMEDATISADSFSASLTAGWGGRGEPARPRRELPEEGRWLGSVITDEAGKAVVELPMPETTSQWRLTARGCTVETLVGQATAKTITRKDFFVSVKAPASLQEGDTVRVLARVHNLTDYAGKAELVLTVFGGAKLDGKLAERKVGVKVDAQGVVEALFDSVTIPAAAAVKVQVTARAGKLRDAVVSTVPVRPWGLEFADNAGGVARNDTSVKVELPAKRKYDSKWMTVSVGADLKRAVIEMALGRPGRPGIPSVRAWGGCPGSDLLATAAALRYAKSVRAPALDVQGLTEQARSLTSALVVSQRKDGGWSWTRGGKDGADWAVSSVSFWALCEAKQQGIVVHADTLTKAQAYLKNTFTRLGASDNDAKAVVLHALSVNDAADFAHANRLHRERNGLSAPALAYTALAMANLKRNEFAGELLTVLAAKGKTITRGKRKLLLWDGGSAHPWLKDEVETTAVAALAMIRVQPTSPKLKEAIAFLMDRRGAGCFVPAKARGPAVAAIAAYYGIGKFAASDYKLTVLVNGKVVRTLASKGAAGTVEFAVPAGRIAEGANLVEFRMAGRGEYAYAVTLRGFSPDLTDLKSWPYPYVRKRYYRHEKLTYRGKPIPAGSTSPVKDIEIGQRVGVFIDVYSNYTYKGYLVMEEPLPAGMMLVEGTLSGRFVHHEVRDGKIVMYFPPGKSISDVHYELIGYATGTYRVLPTVLRDVLHPGKMRVGPAGALKVLKPGETSDDPYKMNDSERYALGKLTFDDGLYKQALTKLSYLFTHNHTYNEREVARMLLWIYTAEGFYDAKQIVKVFEVLRERYPTLEIPYDKILAVGRAYHDIGEYERAYVVYRATINASFINDVNVSAVLEDEGQFLGSIDYQEDLWRQYPDTAEVTAGYFAISQALYQKAPKAHELAKEARRMAAKRGETPDEAKAEPTKAELLTEVIRLLSEFLALYPNDPLADDAAFSMANAYLDLKAFDTVVEVCQRYGPRYPKSDFASGFQYMKALGHFWQRQHPQALSAAKVVAEGKSKDRDFARYIVGQIFHAEGSPGEAIEWYRKVAGQYADAKQAIDYFEAKRLSLEEVNIFRPGKEVEVTLKYRNVKDAFYQVYRVDLMKLYLREKNLANITKVNLAGIKPLVEKTIPLGDGKDYVDKEKATKLALSKEGAYLLICRGDDLFASALVLVTPLKIEMQEDVTSGRVRANVIDAVTGAYVPEVHVKAIGSADKAFRSGETDLRGVYVADNLRGKSTVIARAGEARYAFYRGETWLGAPAQRSGTKAPAARPSDAPDYQTNLRRRNYKVQRDNLESHEQLRRGTNKGVQVQWAH